MVFDIKMEDFREKARLIAGGHMIEAQATITYPSVVLNEIVRIALMLAALNDLEVKFGSMLNAHVAKVWTTLGPEFSHDDRKIAV